MPVVSSRRVSSPPGGVRRNQTRWFRHHRTSPRNLDHSRTSMAEPLRNGCPVIPPAGAIAARLPENGVPAVVDSFAGVLATPVVPARQGATGLPPRSSAGCRSDPAREGSNGHLPTVLGPNTECRNLRGSFRCVHGRSARSANRGCRDRQRCLGQPRCTSTSARLGRLPERRHQVRKRLRRNNIV